MDTINSKAFTLIELLIIVLIIAILAAIAIPNFMEFQTRAKVSRVKSDQRMVAGALEAYCVDEGTYPGPRITGSATLFRFYRGYYALTSPIAYMTNIPADPFGVNISVEAWELSSGGKNYLYSYEFGTGKEGIHTSDNGRGDDAYGDSYPNDCWLLSSAGPDGLEDRPQPGHVGYYTQFYPWLYARANDVNGLLSMIYDPTNGTVSFGQVARSGGVAIHRSPVNVWQQAISR